MTVASEAACETWQESHEKSSEPDSSEVQRYPFYTEASNSVETGCSYSYRSISELVYKTEIELQMLKKKKQTYGNQGVREGRDKLED